MPFDSVIDSFPVQEIRGDFPILSSTINGRPLIYLDNAATSQKPVRVLEAMASYYRNTNANIHRGAHYLANKATEEYENARKVIAAHINAGSEKEINFVRGTTEAVNLVAQTWAKRYISRGEEIIVSGMEHHSNIVPWQMLCEETGAVLKVIPVNEEGELDLEDFSKLLSAGTKLVSICYVSNALGTINPVQQIIKQAHISGAKVFLDAAQAVPHMKLDVQALDCDFLAFSGHKVFGPTGIGVLFGKEELLRSMPPYMGGGEMIRTVSFSGTTYNELPYKFEAGTPHIEGGIVLAEALTYLNSIGLERISAYEHALLTYATDVLQKIDGLRIIGKAREKSSVLSFLIEGLHPYDIGVLLDKQGIAIRTGHHCCQPLMERFEIEGTCRASFAFYNTTEEVDMLSHALRKAQAVLA